MSCAERAGERQSLLQRFTAPRAAPAPSGRARVLAEIETVGRQAIERLELALDGSGTAERIEAMAWAMVGANEIDDADILTPGVDHRNRGPRGPRGWPPSKPSDLLSVLARTPVNQ